MIYLHVSHTNDSDCDLFKFYDLFTAIQYIKKEELVEWMMSDIVDGNFLDSDYTLIHQNLSSDLTSNVYPNQKISN